MIVKSKCVNEILLSLVGNLAIKIDTSAHFYSFYCPLHDKRDIYSLETTFTTFQTF